MSKFLELLGILLFPLSVTHFFIIKIRHFLYDRGIFKSCKIELPVISVGNIQVGGTGKTPLVEKIATTLTEQGFRPVIISRGYGRKEKSPLIVDVLNRDSVSPDQIGDEPFQYLKNLPEIVLGIDGNRCRIARQIQDQYPDAVILLDDALQHRKIKRDIEIITIDGGRWSQNPLLFPFTSFRDTRNSLKKATAFVFSGASQSEIAEKLDYAKNKSRFFTQIKSDRLISADENHILKPAILNGLKIGVISAIANPEKFYNTLAGLNAEVVYKKSFRDHHRYQENEIIRSLNEAKKSGAELLVTTQKDAVKMGAFNSAVLEQVYYLQIVLEVDDAAGFAQMLLEKLKKVQ